MADSTSSHKFSFKGRDLLFFDELKKNLEDLVCPICQDISSNPVQTSCGHLFCWECLKGPTCPVCRQKYNSVPDYFNSRRIKGLKVMCPNRGCDWKGELRDLDGHLSNCTLESVPCPNNCGERLERWKLSVHTKKGCPLRNVKCDYCPYEGRARELSNHKTFCLLVPVECPNMCGSKGPRNTMSLHLDSCPKRLIPCKYSKIGCEWLIAADKMADHLVQAKDDHLEKAMGTVVELSVAVQGLCQQNPNSHTPQLSSHSPSQHWLKNTKLAPICPWVIEMRGFSEKKSESWQSPPFYTHAGGYKMLLRVYGDGYGQFRNAHLGASLWVMKGEYDDQLQWPITLEIEVSLLNQISDDCHDSMTICFANSTLDVASRVVQGRLAKKGWGGSLVTLAELDKGSKRTVKYLQNDTLFFKVDRV